MKLFPGLNMHITFGVRNSYGGISLKCSQLLARRHPFGPTRLCVFWILDSSAFPLPLADQPGVRVLLSACCSYSHHLRVPTFPHLICRPSLGSGLSVALPGPCYATHP